MTELVLPNDTNPLGNAMGGRVMHWIDVAAAVAAIRHAKGPVVTASVDQIDFHHPIPVGGIVVLLAAVNFAGRTSMECGVCVLHEDRTSGERHHVASAYLTFVALDPQTRQPRPVPAVLPETAKDRERYAAAQERRKQRLQGRK